jgi:saccharopine dehydrogenase-like NADP-dependent oxidoreductase
LFDENPINIQGVDISPREFLLKVINPLVKPDEGDGDVCIMYNTVVGEKDQKPYKIEYFMWEEANLEFSAMARVTSFPASIGAKLVALGKIDLKGIRAPEECIFGENYKTFLTELEKKNITIKERGSVMQRAPEWEGEPV